MTNRKVMVNKLTTKDKWDYQTLPTYIIKTGRSKCVIVLPDDATSGDLFASQELQLHIDLITGAELIEVRESQFNEATGPFISIGRTILSREFINNKQIDELGDSGYSMFCNEGNMFVVGRRWGIMYAVYQFLESLGVRWYSPDYTLIPKKLNVKMPPKSSNYKPEFWYRHQYWNNVDTPLWLARMRINGNNGQSVAPKDDMGGSIITMHGCHSYGVIVPPNENFEKHSEWFAVKEDGNRSRSEYCLTNPELRDFVLHKVLDDLRSCEGKIDNYWLSQNDGGLSGCSCDRCTVERLTHGGKERWSANTIYFTNYIADKIFQAFPSVRIKTLAYSYTQVAPENMTASPNVLVEICGNFKEGKDPHRELIKLWSKVTNNISVYTYGGSNYGYWWPFPNEWEMGMQYKWALKSGVKAFYIQGTALGKGSGFVDLRAYISARLAWNPSRNVNKEIKDFCNGYYGPGGKDILTYLNWYSTYAKQHKMEIEGGWGDSERFRQWINKETMDFSEILFQKALSATKDIPIYYSHVRQAYLEVLWGGVMINLEPGSDICDRELSFVPGANVKEIRLKAKLFGEIMRENGYNMKWEGVLFDAESYPH